MDRILPVRPVRCPRAQERCPALYEKWSNQTDDFPRPGTHWFRDFFYPLWRDHGHAQVMVSFFELVAKHFPGDRTAKTITRDTRGE